MSGDSCAEFNPVDAAMNRGIRQVKISRHYDGRSYEVRRVDDDHESGEAEASDADSIALEPFFESEVRDALMT